MFETPKRWPRSSSWLLTLSYLVYPVSIIVLLVGGGTIVQQQQHVVFFSSNASKDEASHPNRNPPTPKSKPKEDGTTTTTSRETSATNKVVQLMALLRQPQQRAAFAPRDVVDDRRMEMDGTKTPPCDTTLLRIPQQDMAAAFDTVVASLAEEYQLGFFTVWGLKLLFATKKKYGIELRKVCASCRDLHQQQQPWAEESRTRPNPAAWMKYCGTNVYGYDATFSALVTYPLLEDTQIKPGLLPTYVYNRPTVFDVTGAATGTTEEFATVDQLKKIDAVFGFIATMVNGYVGIAPDFMGYGGVGDTDDEGWIPRNGYLIRNSYVTATVPVWMKTKLYLQEQSDCASDLADVAFYAGYSEGGYASIAVAEGLQETFHIQPVRVLAGGGPYKWSTEQFYRIFVDGSASETEFLNTNTGREFYTLLLGAAYSSTNTDVANYGTKQDLFHPDFRATGVSWIDDTTLSQATINARLLQVVSNNGSTTKKLDSIWNADILTLFRQAAQAGVRDFCAPNYRGNIVGKTDQFCRALKENDLYETIVNAQYPIDFCHSTNDEIIFYENLPDTAVFNSNPYLTLLSPLSTDHTSAGVTCLTNEVIAIAGGLDKYIPDSFFVTNTAFMQNTNTGGCPVPASSIPTKAPTMSPTTTPTKVPETAKPIATSSEVGSIPDDGGETIFLRKKLKQDNGEFVYMTKPCSFLREKSLTVQEKACTTRKFQIRYKKKKDRLPPASVACRDYICNQFCVKEWGKNRFLYKSNKKVKGKIEVVKSCNWLKKKSSETRKKICSRTIKYKGSTGVQIYGQASDVCTKTCNSSTFFGTLCSTF